MNTAKHLLLAFLIGILVLIGSVFIVLNGTSIYDAYIEKTNLAMIIGIPVSDIQEDYHYVVRFLMDNGSMDFDLPHFPYSKGGKIHFEDVRGIFIFLKKVMLLCSVIILPWVLWNIKRKEYLFLKYTPYFLLGIPLLIGIPIVINFEWTFIKFHELVFSNNYWIFDPSIDPIILALPEGYFMLCALLILLLLVVVGVLLYTLGRKLNTSTTK